MKQIMRIAFLVLCSVVFLRPALGQIGITVAFGPPALPVYELPPCPGDGYLWTPGYWAWDPDYEYYWVPGTWVMAPEPGLLWTPGWWGWEGGGFLFHEGFWGPEVGFYGGIDYGFGYFGLGFVGGRWDGGHFRYNTAVLNVNTTIIHNTYVDRTVIVNQSNVNHVSYNGGEGGITTRPRPEEERADSQRHIPPVAAQQQHVQAARNNPELRASRNQGKPPVAATSRPGEFSGRDVVAAREAGAPYHPPAGHGAQPGAPNRNERGGNEHAAPGATPGHARDLPQHQVTVDPNMSKKAQQQEQKLVEKQNKEHEKLEQQQEKEDKAAQKHANQEKQQQIEQRHQRQTQEMEQRHSQQMEQLRTRQAPSRPR